MMLDIGGITPTRVFTSGKICGRPFCGGFKEIVCNTAEPRIVFNFEAKAPEVK